MRYWASLASTLLVIAILACSGRPVSPSSKTKLAAVPLGIPLITRVSTWQPALTGIDSVRAISFGEVPWRDSVDYGDVEFRCMWAIHSTQHGIYAMDPQIGRWIVVEGALPIEAGGCYGFGPCLANPRRFLSQTFGTSPRRILNGAHELKLAGVNTFEYEARLIQYEPSYDFATIRMQDGFGAPLGLRAQGNFIYFYSTYDNLVTGVLTDSLLMFDRLGTRISGHALPQHYDWDVAIGDAGFWYATDGEVINCVGSDGTQIHSFRWRGPGGTISMCEREGRLWVASGRYGANLTVSEVDVTASDDAGVVVIRWTRQTTLPQLTLLTTHSDGFLVIIGDWLYQLDLDASVVGEWEIPVARVSGIASDGESVWMAHHGPRGIFTDATLLTRFTLE